MKKIFLIVCTACLALSVSAQPAARRNQQQRQSPANTITTRAQISFPTTAPMEEDVVWRRDIYRELKLTEDANAGLYYPTEPVGSQMNLFTYIFKLMMNGPNRGGIAADNYHIFYERTDHGIRLDNSDIPSGEVKGYYLKESAYYDQGTATFHRKVVALCPIMYREDDFGDGEVKYPLFWVRYDDLAPFLAKQTIMTSNLNNAATMSVDDYFTMNLYKGKIYKTTNMLGKTLAQYCPNDSAMAAEQKKIERELVAFEKTIYGDPARRDSLDSISAAKETEIAPRKLGRSRRTSPSTSGVSRSRRSSSSGSAGVSPARVTVRRERH